MKRHGSTREFNNIDPIKKVKTTIMFILERRNPTEKKLDTTSSCRDIFSS